MLAILPRNKKARYHGGDCVIVKWRLRADEDTGLPATWTPAVVCESESEGGYVTVLLSGYPGKACVPMKDIRRQKKPRKGSYVWLDYGLNVWLQAKVVNVWPADLYEVIAPDRGSIKPLRVDRTAMTTYPPMQKFPSRHG
jgi:hypothetical protein